MKATIILSSLLVLFLFTGCQDSIVSPDAEGPVAEAAKPDGVGAILGGMVWADGQVYRTVVTPTELDPDNGPFDALYVGAFKDGIGLISEAKPGDQDYNGGRWEVWVLKADATTDYSNADSDADLNLDDFELAGAYFVCPLQPKK